MKRTNKKGFTIVELVVVIAVIAILAAVMIPTFSGVTKDAKKKAALQEVKSAYSATLAAELTDNSDSDPLNDASAAGTTIYVLASDGETVVAVTANGVPTIDTTNTATYKVAGGKIVAN